MGNKPWTEPAVAVVALSYANIDSQQHRQVQPSQPELETQVA